MFIPEVTLAKDKRRFSMLMNVSWRVGDNDKEGEYKKSLKVKNSDDTYVGRSSQEVSPDDTMTKVRESDSLSSENAWLQPVIQ